MTTDAIGPNRAERASLFDLLDRVYFGGNIVVYVRALSPIGQLNAVLIQPDGLCKPLQSGQPCGFKIGVTRSDLKADEYGFVVVNGTSEILAPQELEGQVPYATSRAGLVGPFRERRQPIMGMGIKATSTVSIAILSEPSLGREGW